MLMTFFGSSFQGIARAVVNCSVVCSKKILEGEWLTRDSATMKFYLSWMVTAHLLYSASWFVPNEGFWPIPL